MFVNSEIKATKIIGQRKAFYRQKISEFSHARKETVDNDILVTSRNGDRKIMQFIRITSRPSSTKRKWNQLSQLWRTSTKVTPIEKLKLATFRRWAKGSREAASEAPTNNPAYVFVACLTIPNSNWGRQPRRVNSIPYMAIW